MKQKLEISNLSTQREAGQMYKVQCVSEKRCFTSNDWADDLPVDISAGLLQTCLPRLFHAAAAAAAAAAHLLP